MPKSCSHPSLRVTAFLLPVLVWCGAGTCTVVSLSKRRSSCHINSYSRTLLSHTSRWMAQSMGYDALIGLRRGSEDITDPIRCGVLVRQLGTNRRLDGVGRWQHKLKERRTRAASSVRGRTSCEVLYGFQ
ncbi:hypothetical protein EDB87DRAFT_1624447 [Lactarius vividus]|nr:hypothetical protein EDB87DRAFT_1624447 [Lactarius vividus]